MILLFPLFFVVIMSFFGYSALLTIIVPLFSEQSSPFFQTEHFSHTTQNLLSGIFLALYPLAQFIGSPIIGSFSDVFGKKKILLLSLACAALCFVGIGLSIHFHQVCFLAVFCFFAGLCESNMAIALSVVGESSDVLQRPKYFGYLWVCCSLGYVLGSFASGILITQLGFVIPFYVIAILFLFCFFSVVFLFQGNNMTRVKNLNIRKSFLNIKTIFEKSSIRSIYFFNFVFYFAVFGTLRTQIIYIEQNWHKGISALAAINGYTSIIAFAANFVIFPRMVKKFGLKNTLLITVFLFAASSILVAIPQQFYWLWITTACVAVFAPMNIAAVSSFLSVSAPEKNQGAIMGNNQALLVLAESLSAFLGSALCNVVLGLPLVVFGIIAAVGGVMFKRSDC